MPHKVLLLAGSLVFAFLSLASQANAAVLYDQLSGAQALEGLYSDNFESPDDQYDGQAADDFTVPAGQVWSIDQVDVAGTFAGTPPNAVNVFLYGDAGSIPGVQLFAQTDIPATPSDYSIPLSKVPLLVPGTYWISVQGEGGRYSGIRAAWIWRLRIPQVGHAAVYQNPGGGFPGCTTWRSGPPCNPTGFPDLAFSLSGASFPYPPPSSPPPKLPANNFTLESHSKTRKRAPTPSRLRSQDRACSSSKARGSPAARGLEDSKRRKHRATPYQGDGQARKKLNATGSAKVTPTITFTPVGGTPSSQTKTIKLRKRR